ncbi:MAG: zinc-binding alcohol dehydrogenase family protein [Pseudorhodobacter sp.]
MKGSAAPSMLRAVCVSPGRFTLAEAPRPMEAAEGWVLVDIDTVGICGTDYHIFEGKHPFLEYPRVIGHELAGRVAMEATGWKAGQPVVINPYLSCGACRACMRGRPNCCADIAVLGVHVDGGMCDRIAVPATNLYDATGLPEGAAALTEFLAIGAHAVRRAGPQAGDRVLITGAGPIGLGVALFARLRGAEVHLRDTSMARLEAMRAFGFGALHQVDAPLEAESFDIVFDATGNRGAMEAGFGLVAHTGVYCLVGIVKDDLCFSDPDFHRREMTLMASRNATAEDFHTVMAAFREGRIDARTITSEVIDLTDMPARFPALAADRDGIVKAVVQIGGAA